MFYSTKTRFIITIAAAFLFFAVLANAQDFSPAGTANITVGGDASSASAPQSRTNAQMSRNGRFVVFESTASNLVNYISVTGGRRHIYLLDRQANLLELVSLDINGNEAPSDSFNPSIDANGRYITFSSTSTVEQMVDVCIDDECHANRVFQGEHIYVRDRDANANFLISQVTVPSKIQALDADGLPKTEKVCKIEGCDTSLDCCGLADPINDCTYTVEPVLEIVDKRISAVDHALVLGSIVLSAPESQHPQITGDGRYVTFDTSANNLAGVGAEYSYLEPEAGVDYCNYGCNTSCPGPFNTGVIDPSVGNSNGVFPAFYRTRDYNGVKDIYVRDGAAFSSKLVSLGCQFHSPDGCGILGEADSVNPDISDDGNFITFQTRSRFLRQDFTNNNDIFLIDRGLINGEVSQLDRISNSTNRLTPSNGESVNATISSDGRYIAFQSTGSNLTSTDTNGQQDIFIYDINFFTTVKCNLPAGTEGNGSAELPAISGSGEYVAFNSNATNWGAGSGNNNVYVGQLVRDGNGRLSSCNVVIGSEGPSASGGNGDSTRPSVGLVPLTLPTPGTRVQVSAIAYESAATDVSVDGSSGFTDIYQSPVCSALDAVTDTDGDGTTDCFDQCKDDILKVIDTDTDADGTADCEDGCPSDPQKLGAGQCGCGVADIDSDLDNTADCAETCDNDPDKTAPGACGCGVSDEDINPANGTPDCNDSITLTPAPTATSSVPVPTPTATATPLPPIPSLVPGNAVVRRIGPSRYQIFLDNIVDFLPILDRYTIQFQQFTFDGRRLVRTKTYTVTPDNFKNLGRLARGQYRARYKVRTLSAEETPYSPYSRKLRVR